jgi:hypothetical protein
MFSRLLPVRDDVTGSATIGPTQIGRPMRGPMNVSDLVSNTGEPESVPIRMPSYAQLVVSSTDRYSDVMEDNQVIPGSAFVERMRNPTSSSNWTLQRPNYLLQGYFTRLAITQVQIQWNLETINASNAPGVSVGNDLLSYNLIYSTTTTSQNIDPTAGDVTLTTDAGLAFVPGNIVNVTSTGQPQTFAGVVVSYSDTTLVIGTITDIFGTFPADLPWTVSTAGSYSSTIPPGFYSPTQLATAITAAMNADIGSAVITVTYETTLYNIGRFTFTCAADYKIVFNAIASNSAVGITKNQTLITLGANAFNFIAPQSVQVFAPPTMSYTRWIDLCSSTLTKYQRVKDATTLPADAHIVTLARIYITPPNVAQNSSFGAGPLNGLPFNFTVDFATPKYIKWSPKEVISNFDIQIRDEFGQLLYWTPNSGIEYQFTLLASET